MRAAFDKLISWTGLLLAALLLVAGAMLTWAWVYIGNEVQAQLSLQDITMPEGKALQSLPPDDQAALQPYAGSPMDTGPEAKAYADHYILVHLNAASKGKTYSEISGQYTAMTPAQKASPEGQALAAVRDTLFQGNTLRGLLLYGAAFATMGTLAGYAAIGAYLGAIVMLLLGLLGMRHARRMEQAAAAEPAAASPVTPEGPVTPTGTVPPTSPVTPTSPA
jgi:hypothetical protein